MEETSGKQEYVASLEDNVITNSDIVNSGEPEFVMVQEVEIAGGDDYVFDGDAIRVIGVSPQTIDGNCTNTILQLCNTSGGVPSIVQFNDEEGRVHYALGDNTIILQPNPNDPPVYELHDPSHVEYSAESNGDNADEVIYYTPEQILPPQKPYIAPGTSLLKVALTKKHEAAARSQVGAPSAECTRNPNAPLPHADLMATTTCVEQTQYGTTMGSSQSDIFNQAIADISSEDNNDDHHSDLANILPDSDYGVSAALAVGDPSVKSEPQIVELEGVDADETILQDPSVDPGIQEFAAAVEQPMLEHMEISEHPSTESQEHHVTLEYKEEIAPMEITSSNDIADSLKAPTDGENRIEDENHVDAASSNDVEITSDKSSLPRFLQVDAKIIQEALKLQAPSELGDLGSSINPVFKICKMARKADGSIECEAMNMRDLNMSDRQRVYRAMLEKFPEIVKKQAANILTPSQLNKLDPQLQSSLKSHRSKNSKLASAPGVAKSPYARKPSVKKISPSEYFERPKSSTNGDPTNAPTPTGHVVSASAVAAGQSLLKKCNSSPSNPSRSVTMSTPLRVENVVKRKAIASETMETVTQSKIDEDSSRTLSENESIAAFPHDIIDLSDSDDNKCQNDEPNCQPSPSKWVARNVPVRMLCKKVNILPVTQHSCSQVHPITCKACKADFDTSKAFDEHCLLHHLKVLPHIFAENFQLRCLLCHGENQPNFSTGTDCEEKTASVVMHAAREHFRRCHSLEQANECEMCKRLIKSDHMYAASQELKANAVEASKIDAPDKNNAEASDPIIMGEEAMVQVESSSAEAAVPEQEKLPLPEASQEPNSTKAPKPSDIYRILKRFDKDHHKTQLPLPSRISPRKLYKCRYCDKEFKKHAIWKMHILAHLGHHPVLCPLCGMSFNRRHSLTLHMQVHLLSQPKDDAVDDPEMAKATLESLRNQRRKLVRKKLSRQKKELGAGENEDNNASADKAAAAAQEMSNPPVSLKGPVLCEVCGKELKNRRQLMKHQYHIHNYPRRRPNKKNLTPTPCPDCEKICRGPSALKNHKRNLCGVKETLCEVCGKVYTSGRALSNHKYQAHKWHESEKGKLALERKRLKLASNDSNETTTDEVQDPVKLESPTEPKLRKAFAPEVCQICGFVGKYSTSMRSHLVNKHKFPKKRTRTFNSSPVACTKCGTVCKGPGALKLHEKRFCLQTTNLQCPVCGKSCSSRKNLSRHKYNHKWWGTDKEKAWKEKRRLLGIPIRKKRTRPTAELPSTAPLGPTYQFLMNIPTDRIEEVVTTEGGSESSTFIDASSFLQVIQTGNGQTELANGLQQQTMQLQLPLINSSPMVNEIVSEDAIATAAITTEEIIPVEDFVEETVSTEDASMDQANTKLVNLLSSYQVVLADENGQPMFAYLPTSSSDKG